MTRQRVDAAEAAEHARRERARIASILHDELQQTLAAAHLHLSLPDGAAEAQVLLKQAIAETRALSHELAGPPPDAPLLTRLHALARIVSDSAGPKKNSVAAAAASTLTNT